MAFSIFNKKGSDPAKPGAARPGGAQRPRDARSSPATGAATTDKIDRIEAEMRSVDFTESGRTDGKSGGLIVEHGFSGGTRQPAVASEPAAKPFGGRSGPVSVMTMEVQESPFESAPALEEAAILYANRQDAVAQSVLEEAIATPDLPPQAARQAWLMLFDLFENHGKRAEFETLALDFAVRFETSPPAFSDRSVEKDASARVGAVPQVNLSGNLDASASRQFDNIRNVAGKNRALRLDFSKVESLDGDGAVQVRAALGALRASGHEVALSSGEHLIGLLRGRIETTRKTDPEAYWLLLLDLFQALDMHDEFETTALDYCITYEVSPPSWVNPPRKAKAPAPAGPATEPMPEDACYIKGEIEGNAAAVIKDIGDFAASRQDVVVDVYHVKRMDFIAAGSLLNLASALAAAGKKVEVRGPSPLLAALLATMGFSAYAKMVRRKPQ